MVIKQLRDALSAKASSQDIPNDLAVVSVDNCVEKVREILHIYPRYHIYKLWHGLLETD